MDEITCNVLVAIFYCNLLLSCDLNVTISLAHENIRPTQKRISVMLSVVSSSLCLRNLQRTLTNESFFHVFIFLRVKICSSCSSQRELKCFSEGSMFETPPGAVMTQPTLFPIKNQAFTIFRITKP